MPTTLERFTTLLQSLGTPETLRSQKLTASPSPVNSHIHLPPNFSAFETIAQAVNLAEGQGIGVLGVSNYYDFSIYAEYADRASQAGILPLFGLEIIALLDDLVQAGLKINDPGNPGKMYLCGKGITQFLPMNPRAQALLQTIRENDSTRMEAMALRLRDLFLSVGVDTGLDAEAVKRRVVARHGSPLETVYLQERHLAQAFQEVFFEQVAEGDRLGVLESLYGTSPKAGASDAVGVQNDIRSFLMKAGKPAFMPDTFVDFDHAYQLIVELGGIPCYPTLCDGTKPITDFEASPEKLVSDLKARGVFCAEFIPIRNSPEVLSRYVKTYREAGMFVTAGTEHNTLDLIPIAPTCDKGVSIPEEIQAIFWEGACVVAAHQFLRLLGHAGYLDANGKPNAEYSTDEARIVAFRELGEAVFARYRSATHSE